MQKPEPGSENRQRGRRTLGTCTVAAPELKPQTHSLEQQTAWEREKQLKYCNDNMLPSQKLFCLYFHLLDCCSPGSLRFLLWGLTLSLLLKGRRTCRLGEIPSSFFFSAPTSPSSIKSMFLGYFNYSQKEKNGILPSFFYPFAFILNHACSCVRLFCFLNPSNLEGALELLPLHFTSSHLDFLSLLPPPPLMPAAVKKSKSTSVLKAPQASTAHSGQS